MSYSIKNIGSIIAATSFISNDDCSIENIITDSRKLLFPTTTLFFALQGQGRNGNDFIEILYQKGLRNFVVDDTFFGEEKYTGANFLLVENVLNALQTLASNHRSKFQYPVIGITGSNGKTIVKEWLYQLLNEDYDIVRSPKSYNSQVGVPLSVWRMQSENNLAIFESGISQPNEMANLQKIILPQIGIVTFIGSAHAENFVSKIEKIKEKLLLFTNSKELIYCKDDEVLDAEIKHFILQHNPALQLFTWGKNTTSNVCISTIETATQKTKISFLYKQKSFKITIPFTDEAAIHNAITCTATLLLLGINQNIITERMLGLRPLSMRLELKQGINNCSIINDSYSADMQSLAISLDFLQQQNQHPKRTVIISDILQTGKSSNDLYQKIVIALLDKNINTLIGIGKDISENAVVFSAIKETYFYPTTDIFLSKFSNHLFANETILLKGARIFEFEKISKLLEQKIHQTRLEINLNALRHNLKVYKNLLQPTTKIMVMVKAFSYGSGSFEIANLLQHSGVHYLAVAYVDEAVELRSAGITLPIMVLNTEQSSFENIVKYSIEPEIYSFNILKNFISFLKEKNIESFPIHIKVDTGMHRLGFAENEIENLCNILQKEKSLKILSVFSHLAGSDAANFDDFTNKQNILFIAAADKIENTIGYSFIKHIANSSAIYRHPTMQHDMIRLGIGLYGVDASVQIQHRLQNVTTLKTTISQIKHLQKGETIGYSRKGIAVENTTTATVSIGYADGYPRSLSNGNGKMFINGNPVPVIGNVCMDMTMLDITGIAASEGDEVIVFGEEPSITNVAQWANTISYEILTNISQRVKRVYYEE